MKQKHRAKHFKVETKASSVCAHHRLQPRESQFWQTRKIWADLCLPERNPMTQLFNINPGHVLRGNGWWKEQNEKGVPALSRCDGRKRLTEKVYLLLPVSVPLQAKWTRPERKTGLSLTPLWSESWSCFVFCWGVRKKTRNNNAAAWNDGVN